MVGIVRMGGDKLALQELPHFDAVLAVDDDDGYDEWRSTVHVLDGFELLKLIHNEFFVAHR